jgi:hypothetical protein
VTQFILRKTKLLPVTPETDNYYLYSGDIEWLQTIWTNYTKAVAFLEAKVDPKVGLMNVTGLRDWARLGGGGFNAEGNAILYRVRYPLSLSVLGH